jgi:hypothetical protein
MTDDFTIFDGFMPLVENIVVSAKTNSIGTDGSLIEIHCIKLILVDGTEHVFSIHPNDLEKLFVTIMKALVK